MRFAAGLTVTGVLGFLVLEALKILLTPVAVWLLGVAMVVVKVAAMSMGLALVLGLGFWAYRRWSTNTDEIAV